MDESKVESNKANASEQQSTEVQENSGGSQKKPGSEEGNLIGLKKQLGREKDKTKKQTDLIKDLESQIASLDTIESNSEEGHPGWVEEKEKKELASLRKKLVVAESAKGNAERQLGILKISTEYGIPMEVLSDVESDKDLALKVLQWQKDKKDEQVTEAGKPSGKFETGNASVVGDMDSAKILAMSTEDFLKYVDKLKTEKQMRK